MLEVIGAGFGRTGTNSLKLALEHLGYGPCYHMHEVIAHPEALPHWQAAVRGEPVDWATVFAGYKAAVDWPAAAFWWELARAYPKALVVLSHRDPDAWYDSVQTTIWPLMRSHREMDPGHMRDTMAMAADLIGGQVFGGRLDDRAHAKAVYQEHLAQVRAEIPAQRLIEIDPADGWEPLCRALDRPVPDLPYPRTNSREEFVAQRGL
jgi:hypothetical protein